MARNSRKVQQARQKKLQRRQRKAKNSLRPTGIIEPSTKVARKLDEVYACIDDGDFVEAAAIIKPLLKKHGHVPAVAEAEVFLYQESNEPQNFCVAAKRLLKAKPRDPEAVMMYAQGSMFCGRASIALLHYRTVVKRWPDHEHAEKARMAIEVCELECKSRLERARNSGFTSLGLDDGGLELFALHEESLELLNAGEFKSAIKLCQNVLDREPGFLSARNNLATCFFQSGELENAAVTARETYRLAPDNRYAQANLAKLEFLTGNSDKANAIADEVVTDIPTEQDALSAAIEAFSFLGRDDDVLIACKVLDSIEKLDTDNRAIGLHHQAVATFRLGDPEAAKKLWKRCLKLMPSHPTARENLADLESGTGHAPWAETISKWIPQPVVKRFVESSAGDRSAPDRNSAEGQLIRSLVPALLDRGDPTGRELALLFAENDASEPMQAALKEFAFSQRGPDSMRYRTMTILHQKGLLDEGPHRFFNNGHWTDIGLYAPEIVFEPLLTAEPWEQSLQLEGYEAQQNGDQDTAEECWLRILERNPDSNSAAYNLATIWLNRDGESGRQRALETFEQLHRRSPEYAFATLGLANLAAQDGDLDRAAELLQTMIRRKRLHISEWTSLLVTQAQVALKRGNLDSAEASFLMLVEAIGKEDPLAIQLRQLIDRQKNPRLLGRWHSQFSKVK